MPMKFRQPDGAVSPADPIADILRDTKTIAVVGLSSNPMRPSFGVAHICNLPAIASSR